MGYRLECGVNYFIHHLLTINKCEIIDDRQVRDYRVEKMRVLGTPDGCESGGVDCEAFTLFDVNHFCE